MNGGPRGIARRRPAVDYYRTLEPEPADDTKLNIVETLVDQAPGIRAATRRIRTREKQLGFPDEARESFVRYADARGELASLRETALFNVGVEIGLIVGRGHRRPLQPLPTRARAHLRAALEMAARALERDGLVGFADELALIVRTALALGAAPAAVADVKRAARRLARRKPRLSRPAQ